MDWTIETLREHLEKMVELQYKGVLEKLAEADIRYQQRFQAQSEALTAAFLAQQTAMQTALVAAEKAVTAALAAADRAVTKAEIASEKRFESVNEFRAVLTEQSRTLMTRAEGQLAISNLNEKLDSRTIAQDTRLREVNDRLTRIEGRTTGVAASWTVIVSVVGVALALLSMLYFRH
jgi:hypothetical protein